MPAWKPIVGKSFTPAKFDDYVHTLQWTAWRPSFIVLHNTAVPALKDRPNGFNAQSMKDFVSYYRDEQKWSAGPHLFVDDSNIWVFTPLTTPGVHSPSWNNVSLGVEMLGNYDTDAFASGRGLQVRKNAGAAMATLCSVLGFQPGPTIIRLHKEDKLTTHKCPGKNVIKQKVIDEVNALILDRHPGEHPIP